MQTFLRMQKTHAADYSTGAREFEATSTRGCGTMNSDAMNNCGMVITQENTKSRMSMEKVLVYGMVLLAFLASTAAGFAQNEVIWKNNFGGNDGEQYESVTAVSDGIVVVGYSWGNSFGNGDWVGVTGKGNVDAIVVKYDNAGNVIWNKNFGGSGYDYFYSVTTVSDGVIAVGSSPGGGTYGNSFGNGDWDTVSGKGEQDAIIVKYDYNGNVIWKKNFGGARDDFYYSVTTVSDGIVAVGTSNIGSYPGDLGTGDWASIAGKGNGDAIVVKYDHNGNVVWNKNFGGSGYDYFYSVTMVSDGVIAVGRSQNESFGNGDWTGIAGKWNYDAIIVKYDFSGNVVWKKNFGGDGNDFYNSITTLPDGIVAVGYSGENSFGDNDWAGIEGRGKDDAVIVKYDNSGNIVWKKNFGGSNYDYYESVTTVSDGMIAVGRSYYSSFGNGDWTGFAGRWYYNAIIVKYDNAGNVLWKNNFGGNDNDYYNSITTVSDGIVAVGKSDASSFGNGDWTGITGKGGDDAIIVKYDLSLMLFVSVTNITNVPTMATASTQLTLTGKIEPSNAVNQSIVWSVKNAGATGATIIGDTLSTTAEGTVKITATITNGKAIGTDYTQDFDIAVAGVGIVETQCVASLRVYPNPAKNQLTIECRDVINHVSTVKIYSVVGQNVGTYQFPPFGGEGVVSSRLGEVKDGQTTPSYGHPSEGGEFSIDISHLANGMYFLKIGNKTARFVKE